MKLFQIIKSQPCVFFPCSLWVHCCVSSCTRHICLLCMCVCLFVCACVLVCVHMCVCLRVCLPLMACLFSTRKSVSFKKTCLSPLPFSQFISSTPLPLPL